MKNTIRVVFALLVLSGLSGCVLTKIVTVPMRIVGGVTSIVPVAGDAAHDAIDEAAETIDEVPL